MDFKPQVVLICSVLLVSTVFSQALNSPMPGTQEEDVLDSQDSPLETTDADNSEASSAEEATKIPEYSDIEVLRPSSASSAQRPGTLRNIPQQTGEYIIVKGDTLWDICDRLLDNPWYWPKLWKLNQYIENPHLIYPGDKLYFYEGSNRSFPDMGFSNKDDENLNGLNNGNNNQNTGNFIADGSIVYQRGSKMNLRPIYFLVEKNIDIRGSVSQALQNKRELSEGDVTYLSMREGVPLPKKGQRFYVIEKISKLHERHNIQEGKIYGQIYRKNAVIEVSAVGSNTIEAVIINSDFAINRGFDFIDYQPQIISFEPEVANTVISSKILGATDQQLMIRDGDYVFIDKGSNQNMQAGMIMYAIRKNDPLTQMSDKNNSRFPEITYGKLVVVEVYKRSSMAYVTDVRDGLEVGEKLKTLVE